MKLIVITTETIFEGEAEAVNLLFENGLETLHLRKPSVSRQETTVFIKKIRGEFHSGIVLHDHYDLMETFHLKGIHLNRRNQANFLKKCTLSRSCHSLADVSASSFCDYVFLSPVFDSISKTGYKHAFTTQQLVEAKEQMIINESVIALGGITAENIPVAYSYGFGGVAVLGALWSDFEVKGDVNELLKRFIELKNKCDTV